MQGNRDRPSIHDVARVAGVSYQTVSRVLNGHGSIRVSTRNRVFEAVAKVGYRRNQAARALVTSRSRIIGVLSSETAHFGPSTSLNAIQTAARDADYRVIVTSPNASGREAIRSGLEYLMDQSIEALVVMAPHMVMLEVLEDLAIDVPYVTLLGGKWDRSVSVDQHDGARLATRYLLSLGHTEIAHMSGPGGWIETEARAEAFMDELALHQVSPGPIVAADWTARAGYQLGLSMLQRRQFSAVFCANDQMALGFIYACREAGLSVPKDVSVVGFDDIPEAAFFLPPLTTVRQNFPELGRRAISILLSQLSGEVPEEQAPVPAKLVIRESATRRR
jgi:DNA-binding LacI/PurR family transcriptional regulator